MMVITLSFVEEMRCGFRGRRIQGHDQAYDQTVCRKSRATAML
jgi:hypothetical protein